MPSGIVSIGLQINLTKEGLTPQQDEAMNKWQAKSIQAQQTTAPNSTFAEDLAELLRLLEVTSEHVQCRLNTVHTSEEAGRTQNSFGDIDQGLFTSALSVTMAHLSSDD